MGDLIKAEFRKTTTTGLWWGLMIPAVLMALGWSLGTGAIFTSVGDVMSSSEAEDLTTMLGVDPSQWQLSVFGMTRSINVATIFPMIFGGLAISNEINRRTITTTFLTAPTRVSAMLAKMVVYIAWGAIFGVAIVASVSIGIGLTSNSNNLPDAGGWLALAAVGILSSILMTMFGVGVGALMTSVVGTTVVLILYMLLIENGLHFVLASQDLSGIIGFLPNGAVNGLTGSVAASLFLSNAGVVPDELVEVVRAFAGALGAFDWWLSGLIFLVWTGLFFVGGWAATQRKDIT
ncbi:ABC-2 type transport system permease protein [Saccharothrix ecbatanensis]|jgi:ABC-2 type transport system permease protein|uniref:ABC-2 type transport system permease protein n=1 Tax=Saccharothrix ecbatanensis TaxID=1105145 RepID=A0A7W9M393_9PSEU|nr:ABC transporter permease subunit [Saccharothrix ecbatanensis]MBB5805810.1 ABC-2 type transport system permease protein [Saccharothrix ecbatanensis]